MYAPPTIVPINIAKTRGHNAVVKIIKQHEVWLIQRVLWIGHYKNSPTTCVFAHLSRELVFHIIQVAFNP